MCTAAILSEPVCHHRIIGTLSRCGPHCEGTGRRFDAALRLSSTWTTTEVGYFESVGFIVPSAAFSARCVRGSAQPQCALTTSAVTYVGLSTVPAALSRAQAQCLTEWYDSFAKPMGAEPSASQVHCALSAHWKGSLELMCPSGRKSVYAEAALRHAVRGDCAVGYRREDCGHRWAAHSAARNSKHARKRALNTPKPLCSTSALVDPCRKEHFSDRVLHRWMGSGHSCSAHAFCCWSTGTVAHACNAQHYSCLWDWAALLDQRWLDQHRTRTNAHVTICKRVCCAMELCTHCSYE